MMLLHQVLPKDENGNKKMVETFLEGKMMLTDPLNGKGAFIKYADYSLAFFYRLYLPWVDIREEISLLLKVSKSRKQIL
jgi:hypothetical protein